MFDLSFDDGTMVSSMRQRHSDSAAAQAEAVDAALRIMIDRRPPLSLMIVAVKDRATGEAMRVKVVIAVSPDDGLR